MVKYCTSYSFHTWKEQISNYGKRISDKALANIVIPNMKVKEVYGKLLRPPAQKPTSQKTVEKLLSVDDMNCPEVYIMPRKASISSFIRIFQCKILNDILYLNDRISTFDPHALFALKNSKTFYPFLCHCNKTQILWETLRNQVAGFLSLPKLEPELAFLGK